MPKLFDRVVLDVIIIIGTLLWTSYLISSPVWVVVVTLSVYLVLKILYLFLFNRYRNLKTLPTGEMEFLLSVMTPDEQAKHMVKTLPEQAIYFKENNYFCVSVEGAQTIVFCFYKFSAISNEDIAKAYRTAKDKKIYRVAFFGRTPNRQTMVLTRRLGLSARFVPSHALKRYLYKHNALPESLKQRKTERPKFDIKATLIEIFHPRRAKYFAFTGIVLAFMSIFTPLKLYYIVLSSVALAVAGISICLRAK